MYPPSEKQIIGLLSLFFSYIAILSSLFLSHSLLFPVEIQVTYVQVNKSRGRHGDEVNIKFSNQTRNQDMILSHVPVH